jgi:hypothetical protein
MNGCSRMADAPLAIRADAAARERSLLTRFRRLAPDPDRDAGPLHALPTNLRV